MTKRNHRVLRNILLSGRKFAQLSAQLREAKIQLFVSDRNARVMHNRLTMLIEWRNYHNDKKLQAAKIEQFVLQRTLRLQQDCLFEWHDYEEEIQDNSAAGLTHRQEHAIAFDSGLTGRQEPQAVTIPEKIKVVPELKASAFIELGDVYKTVRESNEDALSNVLLFGGNSAKSLSIYGPSGVDDVFGKSADTFRGGTLYHLGADKVLEATFTRWQEPRNQEEVKVEVYTTTESQDHNFRHAGGVSLNALDVCLTQLCLGWQECDDQAKHFKPSTQIPSQKPVQVSRRSRRLGCKYVRSEAEITYVPGRTS